MCHYESEKRALISTWKCTIMCGETRCGSFQHSRWPLAARFKSRGNGRDKRRGGKETGGEGQRRKWQGKEVRGREGREGRHGKGKKGRTAGEGEGKGEGNRSTVISKSRRLYRGLMRSSLYFSVQPAPPDSGYITGVSTHLINRQNVHYYRQLMNNNKHCTVLKERLWNKNIIVTTKWTQNNYSW